MNTGKYIILFLSLVLLTVAGDFLLDNWRFKEGDHQHVQKEINRKFQRADRLINKLQEVDWQLDVQFYDDQDIIMLVYRHDTLIYWSDNVFPFDQFDKNLVTEKRFDSISHGWYVIKPYISDSIRAYALILVKSQYPYENDFLVNGFQPSLKLPASTELFAEAQPGSFAILDWEGIYLFSIKFSVSELRYSRLEKYLIPSLIFLTMLCALFLINHILSRITRVYLRNMLILLLPFFLFVIRWIQYRYHLPADIFDLELFGPIPFAKSDWLPSLGDMFINTMLVLFVILQFYLGFAFPERFQKKNRAVNTLTLTMMIVLVTGFCIYIQFILSNLILHSIISFEFYKAASLSVYTFIGLVIMAMHYAALLLLVNKFLRIWHTTWKLLTLIVIFLLISFAIYIFLHFPYNDTDLGSHLGFVLIFLVLAIFYYRGIPLGSYTSMVLMVIFYTAFSVYIINHYTSMKMKNNMRVIAENLSAQQDPVAEYLLEDISKRLSQDQILNNYMFNWSISTEQIHNYLQSNYFNGFWGKYKLWIKDCSPVTQEFFDSDTLTHCYDFYRERMEEGRSMQLPLTRFYFLDSRNGRINYLGWITYNHPHRKGERSLFIELESRLVAEELGFPDLLLDKKYQKNKLLEEYSYAKYYKNQLLAQSGPFQYSLDLNTYKGKPEKFGGYNHLIYNMNNNNVVMVSRPTTNFFNKLVSFSYIFIFYYVIVLIFIVIRDFSKLGKEIEFNFKGKIQLSIMAIIFLSLFLVGGGTIYFSIEQYQNKQHDILSEKIQSVYVELDHLLAYMPNRIPPDWKNDGYDNLNQLLIRFSDVFYTDINLYDPEGNLLATSRPEIFDEGIMGNKMDPMAYSKMVEEKQAEFIHRETIGELSFLSAYVPFVNAIDNKLLAYLNLPYFTKQNVLRNDVTTLVVAIINIYVLLILLTIGMAVLISDQITRPLRLIQQKFSQIKLGKKNEQIIYKGHDEIAGLVDEYNRMVKELARSVNMLARSERESAWREMAKQVAHEIKNPLTPMKLSVQHLLRSWKDNRENFEEYLEKVTRTLIEQIDNLSFIASEFSNFAKMPKAFNEEIDIVDKVRSTLTLFANTENVDFVFEHESEKISVFADKEQLSRVFINLIKNAIQSIPDSRQGKISICLIMNGKMVRVSVTDNGKGVPEELHDKLFTPSFTTKSSGMGLGLSIVKSIIESFGGTITFKTKVNHGTTFVFEIPVHQEASGSD